MPFAVQDWRLAPWSAICLAMRQKELRIALVCYGGISLAVYMHGVTKEVWQLAKASRGFLAGDAGNESTGAVYRRFLEAIEAHKGLRLRVLTDVVAVLRATDDRGEGHGALVALATDQDGLQLRHVG